MAIQRYRTDYKRLSTEEISKWKNIPPSIAGDCMNRGNVMAARMTPLAPGMTICGQARTVTTMVGDNGAAHAALMIAEPGDVLVIDGRGHLDTAIWGGIMTRAAMKCGVAGVVIDGALRDAAEIIELGLATYSAGVCPAGPSKGFGGTIDGIISCAECPVKPGDIILGDDDGIAVVPLERESEIYALCLKQMAIEDEINANTAAGTLPAERFNLVIEDIG
jgi:4-hydroxy-4-methyl-2-oxoglutarate aldolase